MSKHSIQVSLSLSLIDVLLHHAVFVSCIKAHTGTDNFFLRVIFFPVTSKAK